MKTDWKSKKTWGNTTIIVFTLIVGIYASDQREGLISSGHFETVNLDPALGIIIPAAAASKSMGMLNQCSRSGPALGTIKEFWTPSPGDIAKLERALPAYMKQYNFTPMKLEFYTRYYLGIVYPNKTIIYVDFQKDPGVTPVAGLPPGVCDGGDNYFGVEYDTGTGSFSNLEFNGPA